MYLGLHLSILDDLLLGSGGVLNVLVLVPHVLLRVEHLLSRSLESKHIRREGGVVVDQELAVEKGEG